MNKNTLEKRIERLEVDSIARKTIEECINQLEKRSVCIDSTSNPFVTIKDAVEIAKIYIEQAAYSGYFINGSGNNK